MAHGRASLLGIRLHQQPLPFGENGGEPVKGNAINLTVRPAMARATCVTEDGAHLHSEMASDMC